MKAASTVIIAIEATDLRMAAVALGAFAFVIVLLFYGVIAQLR